MSSWIPGQSRPMSISSMGGALGAEASDADLADVPFSREEIDSIEVALATYGTVVFRKQRVRDEIRLSFVQAFGPAIGGRIQEIADEDSQFVDVGTVDRHGNLYNSNDARGMYMRANELWHTDGSHCQPPIRLTVLHAQVLPPEPPPTEFANMRAAWESLPASTQKEIEHLQVEHNILWSRQQIGMKPEDFSEQTRSVIRPVRHPLVRTHPLNGKKSLYLASHASHIVGWPLDEGRRLLKSLMEFATRPEFVYIHHWQPHDLLIWDNRWTMHRATTYSGPYPRNLRWCGVRELEPSC